MLALKNLRLDILNDKYKNSTLPYVFDRLISHSRGVYFTRGLIELNQFDLLSQLAFPTFDDFEFC